MQVIEETGDAHFNPLQWLRPQATMSSAATTFPESAAKTSSSLKCPIVADAAQVSLEVATDTEEVPAASPTSTTSTTGGCPFAAQVFKQKEAQASRQFVFGVGPRTCVGQQLSFAELVTFLIVLAREVKEVQMSEEEQERELAQFFSHPTGLPLRFIPRGH
jgi:hypothetical protein